MEIEKYNTIAARPAIQKALRRIELFVNNLHVRKSTRAFWEQLKQESFESINAALLPQEKENATMETKKTISDMHNAMREMFAKAPKEVRERARWLAIYDFGNRGNVFAYGRPFIENEFFTAMELVGTIGLSQYPPDAWKQSLIEVNGEAKEAPTASSGFAPVQMGDFDVDGELIRGVFTFLKRHAVATGNLISVNVIVRSFGGIDHLVHKVQNLPDLNAFLEQQWLALGGQKGGQVR